MYDINYWAVVVAAVINFFIGWAWYSPMLFGTLWMRELGIHMDGMKPSMNTMLPPMLAALVQQLITVYVLAHVAIAFGALDVMGAVQLAVWVWLGFMATTVLAPVLWEKRSLTWYFITAGQLLVTTVIASLIVVLWQ
jgi:hypothetical protein